VGFGFAPDFLGGGKSKCSEKMQKLAKNEKNTRNGVFIVLKKGL
jgi:hypothetical protein